MKIIVPVDGSASSNNAVSFITHRTSLLGKDPTIILLNVQTHLPSRALNMASPDTLKVFYKEEFDHALDQARKILEIAGMKYEEVKLVGKPADVIAQEAQKRDADLIVMGFQGHTAMAGLLFGSVTNGVLAQTKTPVLLLRGEAMPNADHLKVGIAVDGSEFGLKAVDYALGHRALFGSDAKFEVINVSQEEPTSYAMPSSARSLMDTIQKSNEPAVQPSSTPAIDATKPLFEKAGIVANAVQLVGKPGQAIAQYAKNAQLDMLVLGSHGYGRFMSAVMGSTAMRIASMAEIPLLVVR